MRAGDVIFVSSKGWLSGLIKKYDPGRFTHVAIAVSDTEIFEAQSYMKTKIVPMHYTHYVAVPLNLSDKEKEKLRFACELLSGRWYDYAQALGYVFRYYFGSDINKFNNPNFLICSEALGLILYMLDKIDEPLPNVTPNELYHLLKGGLNHEWR